jgi:L-ascorbate metabolism protein UlaG (beta-lactamase superfamily)
MMLTKYSHACVRLADGDRRLVIDPGVFSEAAEALEDIDAVLITHVHPDHIDGPALLKAAAANKHLKIWAPRQVIGEVEGIASLGDRAIAVGPAKSFIAGGLQVRTYGGQHALIHSSVPVVSNIAYLVGDAVYHPGDSYTVPNAIVEALLIPINAPWARVSDTYDFAISVRAPRAFQIHDALLSEAGAGIYEAHLNRVGELYGTTTFQHLSPRETVEL